MRKHFAFFCLITFGTIAAVIFSGCATIFGYAGSETVNIKSTPDQANVLITDETGVKVFEGTTPTIVPLEKKKGYFSGKTYTLEISKVGYADKTITIDTKADGWYIGGNLVFGGLIGWLIVDPLTGAMWTLNTNKVDVTLQSAKEGMLMKANKNGIVLLKDVPASLRNKMVRVTE